MAKITKKIFDKFLNWALLSLSFFSIAIPLIKAKSVEEEASPEVPIITHSSNTALFEKSPSTSVYKNYDSQNSAKEIPQPGQASFFLTNLSSSASVVSVINFDYAINPTTSIIEEVRYKGVGIINPKDYLAADLNKELKEKIDFDSDTSIN